jgi:hypothetical protein
MSKEVKNEKSKSRKGGSLFPNKVDTQAEYQVTRTLADNYIQLIKHIRKNENKAQQDYLDTGRPEYAIQVGGGKWVRLRISARFIDHQFEQLLTENPEQSTMLKQREKEEKAKIFARNIERHGKGEILLLNELLWAYASLCGRVEFTGDKITDIMSLKGLDSVEPFKSDNVQTKETFTDRLRLLNSTEITLTDNEKRRERFFRFTMFSQVEYAKKHGTEEPNKKIITKVWGELLPGYDKRNLLRGRNRLFKVLELSRHQQLPQLILNIYLVAP